MSYFGLIVFVVTCPLLNVQFHPGNQPRGTLCAWPQPTVLLIIHVTDHLTHMLSTVALSWGIRSAMNIWNIDAWQRENYLTSAEWYHFMALSDKLSYLLDGIMLLSQIIATMLSTVKFERNNLPFTIRDILKGEFNWTVYCTDYVLNNISDCCPRPPEKPMGSSSWWPDNIYAYMPPQTIVLLHFYTFRTIYTFLYKTENTMGASGSDIWGPEAGISGRDK